MWYAVIRGLPCQILPFSLWRGKTRGVLCLCTPHPWVLATVWSPVSFPLPKTNPMGCLPKTTQLLCPIFWNGLGPNHVFLWSPLLLCRLEEKRMSSVMSVNNCEGGCYDSVEYMTCEWQWIWLWCLFVCMMKLSRWVWWNGVMAIPTTISFIHTFSSSSCMVAPALWLVGQFENRQYWMHRFGDDSASVPTIVLSNKLVWRVKGLNLVSSPNCTSQHHQHHERYERSHTSPRYHNSRSIYFVIGNFALLCDGWQHLWILITTQH